MSMTMLRSALRRSSPASQFSRCDTSRNMCSGGPDENKRTKTLEVLFVTTAAISMATYAYVVRGRTLLGYTKDEVEEEQVKVDKEIF